MHDQKENKKCPDDVRGHLHARCVIPITSDISRMFSRRLEMNKVEEKWSEGTPTVKLCHSETLVFYSSYTSTALCFSIRDTAYFLSVYDYWWCVHEACSHVVISEYKQLFFLQHLKLIQQKKKIKCKLLTRRCHKYRNRVNICMKFIEVKDA